MGTTQVAAIRNVPEDHRPEHSGKGKKAARHITLWLMPVPHHTADRSPPVHTLRNPVHETSPPFSCNRTFGTRLNSRVLKRTV
jgi:hypothetical protein